MTGRRGFLGLSFLNISSFCVLLQLLVMGGVARADWPPLPPEDLKMTSVPDLPGVPAIILLRSEVDNDPMNYEETYVRIKILTDEGRRRADVEIPYSRRNFHIDGISGRTVHADGTVVPFDGKVFDKEVFRKRESGGRDVKEHVKSFTLPDVQVGSVIEYRYSLRYDDHSFYSPHWDVQDDLFQREAKFKFIPYAGLLKLEHDRVGNGVMWTLFLPPGPAPQYHELPHAGLQSNRQSSEYIDLEMKNVPPIVHEPYMPPVEAMRYRVQFYYMVTKKQEEYWKEEGKFWNKDVENFLGKKNGVEAAATQAIADGDTPDQKVKKIYAVVTKLDNWSYQPERAAKEEKALGIKPNAGAEDVLRQHGGDHDDLNRLFVAMVRAVGIPSSLMLVPSRDWTFFDPAFMSMGQFAAEIAIVQLGGKDLFLDPGTRFCPYGVLDWRYSAVKGMRQSAESKGTEFADTPLTDFNKTQVQRLARLKLTEDGKAEGTVKVAFYGQEQLDLRREGGRTDAEGRKKLLEDEMKRWLPADSDVALAGAPPNWESTEGMLLAEFKVSAPLAVSSGKRWVVPVHVFQVNEKARFAASKRINPVYFDYPVRETDEVHLVLPTGMEVESLPSNEKIQTSFAAYATTQKQDADHTVVAIRDLIEGGLMFPPNEYGNLKGFFDKVKASDDQPLLLKGTAHAELK